MPDLCSFEYAIIRVVPQVERQEFLNAGVVLFAKTRNFLDVRIDKNIARLAHFAPSADRQKVQEQLQAIETICAGGAAAGYFGGLSQSERFNWIVAPSSDIIQCSPVHTGCGKDPAKELDALYKLLVK